MCFVFLSGYSNSRLGVLPISPLPVTPAKK
jgi:hypothetical protein